jgi:protein TonB
MRFTPIKLALGFSLLLHGGIYAAVHTIHSFQTASVEHAGTQSSTELVIVAAPAEVRASQPPAPVTSEPPAQPFAEPVSPVDTSLRAENIPTSTEVPQMVATVAHIETNAPPAPLQSLIAHEAVATSVSHDHDAFESEIHGSKINCLYNPNPAYPLEARRDRQEGLVILSVLVNEGGRPQQVLIAQSSGFVLLDRAAIDAVKQWQFSPARMADQALLSQVEIPIRFKLTSQR